MRVRPSPSWSARLAAAAISTAAILLRVTPAQACGGAFYTKAAGADTIVVTNHKMAFAITPKQTVLWDEIHFTGSPSEFAFVVPARPGAVLELASDAWFAALDARTHPVVVGPSRECGGAGGCSLVGCGSSERTGGAAPSDEVDVVSTSVQGPYAVETVHSSSGASIEAWLATAGFTVPASAKPVLDAYASAGFDFIVARVRPGASVQDMQPVRLVTPGADPTLPLRMLAVGTGAQVDVTLYVVSEGRYRVQGMPEATLDATKLAWNGAAAHSNYDDVAHAAMSAAGGLSWLTEWAGPVFDSLLDASDSTPAHDLRVTYTDTCQPSGDVCGGDDGGCAPGAKCDDFAIATDGMVASSSWITRLRADLPSSALGNGDLRLEAAASQDRVEGRYSTDAFTDPTYDPCGAGAAASPGDAASAMRGSLRRHAGDGATVLLAALGVALIGRRKRDSGS